MANNLFSRAISVSEGVQFLLCLENISRNVTSQSIKLEACVSSRQVLNLPYDRCRNVFKCSKKLLAPGRTRCFRNPDHQNPD